jgi:hypothetical protein
MIYVIHPSKVPTHLVRGESKKLPNAHSGQVPKVYPLLDGPEQWSIQWSGRIKWYFTSHDIEGYVDETIKHPHPSIDPKSTRNWRKNDAHAGSIIISNISESQLMHTLCY